MKVITVRMPNGEKTRFEGDRFSLDVQGGVLLVHNFCANGMLVHLALPPGSWLGVSETEEP